MIALAFLGAYVLAVGLAGAVYARHRDGVIERWTFGAGIANVAIGAFLLALALAR